MSSEAGESGGRASSLLALAAVGWGVLLVVGALTVPVYESVSQTNDAPPVRERETLVEADGAQALALCALPALVAAFAAWSVARARGGDAAARRRATVAAVMLGAFCLVSIASVGLLVAPIPLLLAASLALAPPPGGPGRSAS
jgi:hypothetical protein